MEITLSAYQARVIGCLIEKEITTPEQYPLSLHSLTTACNQKSNREPVLTLDETTVQQTLDELVKKRLVLDKSGFGSRVVKYQHRFCNTEFGTLKLSPQELGILCVLLLRGPQTPGELRTRSNRLCAFSDVQAVETTLRQLMERDDGPFVIQLPREAGKRESRYQHLFSSDMPLPETAGQVENTTQPRESDHDRLNRLEQLVSELHQEVEQLKERIGQIDIAGD